MGTMSTAEKYRKASKVVWLFGAFFTWSFFYSILKGSAREPAIDWGICIALALGVQYILTLVEGTLITGKLPAPWALDFRNDTTMAILSVAATGCFVFDVLLNLGGVYSVTSRMGTAMGDVRQLGISDYMIQVVGFVATVFFSMLFALGSELLDKLAELEESGRSFSELRRQPKSPQRSAIQHRANVEQVQVAAQQRSAAETVARANRGPERVEATEMTDAQLLARLNEQRQRGGK